MAGSAEKRLVTRINRALKGTGLTYAQFVVLGHLASLPGKSAYRAASSRIAPQTEDIFRDWQDRDIDALHTLLYRLKSDLRGQTH